MLTKLQLGKFGLVATAAMSLVACESSGSYRLASVGTVPDGSSSGGGTASSSGGDGSSSSSGGTASSSGGGTASSSGGGSSSSSSSGGTGPLGGKIIVTAGNAVIGVAGKHNELAGTVNGAVPQLTPVTATVTRVLTKTGQTLVNLGNGNSLILNKAGGKVGDILKIDLGSRTVIGAPSGSPLLGVAVLSPPGSGNLATVTVNKTTGAVSTITSPVTSALPGVASPQAGATGAVKTVVTKTTGTVTGVLGGLKTGK